MHTQINLSTHTHTNIPTWMAILYSSTDSHFNSSRARSWESISFDSTTLSSLNCCILLRAHSLCSSARYWHSSKDSTAGSLLRSLGDNKGSSLFGNGNIDTEHALHNTFTNRALLEPYHALCAGAPLFRVRLQCILSWHHRSLQSLQFMHGLPAICYNPCWPLEDSRFWFILRWSFSNNGNICKQTTNR